MKASEVVIAAHYLSSNMCHTCCVACKNKACSLHGEIEECKRCKNNQCIYNDEYDCKRYDSCGSCRNIHCVNNEKFNPKEEFAKHC